MFHSLRHRFRGAVLTLALAAGLVAPGTALALHAVCIHDVDVIMPGGSTIHCGTFCMVYRDDGSYAGWMWS
jgi:hypothetical protein